MADHPDIYADGFSLSWGPTGYTLTLTLSQPTGEPGPHQDPVSLVGRVRFGPTLAQGIAEALRQAASTPIVGSNQDANTIKH